jgi:hypothetical protein
VRGDVGADGTGGLTNTDGDTGDGVVEAGKSVKF